jgi:hypothetical protein
MLIVAVSMKVGWISFLAAVVILVLLPGNITGSEPEFSGIPEDGVLINPLKASVSFPDMENSTIRWFLDGDEIGIGPSIQRFVYPGLHNLTLEIEYQNGTVFTRSFDLDPVPPPGYNDEPDNTRNRIIFWSIFGTGGLIFAAAAAWIWLKRDSENEGELKDNRVKIQ